jgi:hypothetical protein
MATDLLPLSAEEWQRAKPLVTTLTGLPAPARAAAIAKALPNEPTLHAKLLAFLEVIDRASSPFALIGPAGATGPTAAASLEPEGRLSPGEMAGPYRVLRPLGAGGMGHVFLAEDTRLGRQVALKAIGPHPSVGSARASVLREAQAAAALRHPGIATLHDVLDEAQGLLLVMEYVDGRSLSELAADGPLPACDALRLTAQIADAIGYAHEQGVVHCDIKPANVQLDARGQPKVLDFGLAHLQLDGAWKDDRGTGQLFGTAHYIAPERLVKGSASPSCDIYSLGVVLFELLTGRVPFHDPDEAQLFFDVLTAPPPSPSSLAPDVPHDVDRIVARALAKSPQARFQSAHEMASAARQVVAALERASAQGLAGVSAARPASARIGRARSQASARRRVRTVLAAAAGALVFVTFVGFVSTQVYNTAFDRTGRFNNESPWSWPVKGAEALVAPVLYLAIVLVALGIGYSALRLAAPGVVSTIRSRLAPILDATPPRLAEGLLLASAAGLVLFVWRFTPLIAAIGEVRTASAPDGLIPLRPGNVGEHLLYRAWSTLLLFVSGGVWLLILRRAAERAKAVGVTTLSAGAAVLLATVFLWAMPHRLIFQGRHLRVVRDGQPCYIIGSHQDESLLFCPLAAASGRTMVVKTAGLSTDRTERVLENIFSELDRLASLDTRRPR